MDENIPDAHDDPLTVALAVLDPERFMSVLDDLTDAYAARRTAGAPAVDPSVAARRLAEHKRRANDPTWIAWSATAAVSGIPEG